MKRFAHSWAFAGLALAILFAAMAPRAAAQDGAIAGQILDVVGKALGGYSGPNRKRSGS